MDKLWELWGTVWPYIREWLLNWQMFTRMTNRRRLSLLKKLPLFKKSHHKPVPLTINHSTPGHTTSFGRQQISEPYLNLKIHSGDAHNTTRTYTTEAIYCIISPETNTHHHSTSLLSACNAASNNNGCGLWLLHKAVRCLPKLFWMLMEKRQHKTFSCLSH